jgi:nucleotide-binding universal stress UspA family protein
LHPTDFSAGADAALACAVTLCHQFSGSLTILHVQEIPVDLPGFLFTATMRKEVEDECRASMARAKDRANRVAIELAGHEPNLAIGTQIVLGTPSTEIVAIAKRDHYDVIVMGTHGRRGLEQLLLGSVAERVVRLASCPVLTVRETPPSAT